MQEVTDSSSVVPTTEPCISCRGLTDLRRCVGFLFLSFAPHAGCARVRRQAPFSSRRFDEKDGCKRHGGQKKPTEKTTGRRGRCCARACLHILYLAFWHAHPLRRKVYATAHAVRSIRPSLCAAEGAAICVKARAPQRTARFYLRQRYSHAKRTT